MFNISTIQFRNVIISHYSVNIMPIVITQDHIFAFSLSMYKLLGPNNIK